MVGFYTFLNEDFITGFIADVILVFVFMLVNFDWFLLYGLVGVVLSKGVIKFQCKNYKYHQKDSLQLF